MRIVVCVIGSLLIAGCSDKSPDQAAPRPEADRQGRPTTPVAPASLVLLDSVELIPVPAAPPGIAVPGVTGTGAVVDRINAALDRERREATEGREDCLRRAEGRETSYALQAAERYNGNGLLSFHMSGYSFCGGARGSPMSGALTFDLRTGGELDVAALSGRNPEQLATLGRRYYAGHPDCKAFVRENPNLTRFAAAFVDRRGLGIVLAFDAGAAERCTDDPAIIPVAALRSSVEPRGPLRRAWSGVDAAASVPVLAPVADTEAARELAAGPRCSLRAGEGATLVAVGGDAVARIDGILVHLRGAPLRWEELTGGGRFTSRDTVIDVALNRELGEGDAVGGTYTKPVLVTVSRGGRTARFDAAWVCRT